MVSARRMRSSRLTSPVNATATDSEPPSLEVKATSMPQSGVWQEPALRPPAPSFEDYKGYERNAILKNMMPLGHFPSQKEKDRILRSDVPAARKSTLPKMGKKTPPKDDADTREATPVVNHVGSRDSAPKTTIVNGKKGNGIYGSTAFAEPPPVLKATGQKIPDVPNPSSPGRVRLKSVVDAALRRATEQGNPYLGKAIERLWQDSIKEPRIADLMEAVLSRRPTPQQTEEFQERVKIAKKACKEADMSARHPSSGVNSASKSAMQSPSKSDRGSVARRLGTAEDSSDAPGSNRNLNPPSLKRHANHMDVNGTPSKSERPSKRHKRLKSFSSSTSSLSSISSTENEPPSRHDKGSSATDQPQLLSPLGKQPIGPRLHSFPLNTNYRSSNRQPANHDTQSAEDTVDETDAQRRKLRKTHDVTVNDSNLRKPLNGAVQQLIRSERATPSITIKAAQSRLRNGGLTDDVDVESSLSPLDGELLAPPFPSDQMVTRGATPNRLGRPPKNMRKGARVKMS
ncbi:MAG: hypothetical protein Q9191_006519 [Dirinaria sp. TL-2023a]